MDEPGGPPLSLEEFRQLGELIREEVGISLGEHKQTLLRARLGRRLRHHGLTSYQQYYELLRKEGPAGAERRAMINAVTTNLTSFFREEHHFATLRERLLEPAFARPERRLRLWSAGCSTGEEPYSMAITVLDVLGARPADVRILASDIDTEVLAQAESGVYAAARVQTVPDPLLRRYFRRGVGASEGHVRLAEQVRALITFRRLNFRDPAWPIRTRFDAIFCRNVLIYFDRPLQEQIVARFVSLLVPGGWLFLGHSESGLGNRRDLYNRGRTAYQKREDAE